jgi:hypothetical protein
MKWEKDNFIHPLLADNTSLLAGWLAVFRTSNSAI